MFAMFAAILDAIVEAITLSGSLSASGSSATITGTARTVTVPVGNGGVLRFASLLVPDFTGVAQYKKNADAFATITSNLEVTFANGDTLQVRGATMASGDVVGATIQDAATGYTAVQSFTITRV